MTLNNYYDSLYKIVIIGDSNVGKSSLLSRFTHNIFDDFGESTIGVDYFIKKLNYYDKIIKLKIWDTAGQEKFNSISTFYFRDADCVIFAFDLTNMKSFNNISYWYNFFLNKTSNFDVLKVIVGNKSDLIIEREISKNQVELLKEKLYIEKYFETSAKTTKNINELFFYIIKKINEIDYDSDSEISIGLSDDEYRQCC